MNIQRVVNNFILILGLSVTGALISSCKPSFQNKTELISYIQDADNGLVQSEQIGDIHADLVYRPKQLLQQNKNQRKDNGRDKIYFVLRLSANNKEVFRQLDFSKYSEIIQTFSFRMNELITLTSSGKSINPKGCYYQPTYGVGHANELLISFEKKNITNGNNWLIRVNEFGLGTGDLLFRFDSKEIQKIDKIKIDNSLN